MLRFLLAIVVALALSVVVTLLLSSSLSKPSLVVEATDNQEEEAIKSRSRSSRSSTDSDNSRSSNPSRTTGNAAAILSEEDEDGALWTVSWNAPILSTSGYGSEALAMTLGLKEVLLERSTKEQQQQQQEEKNKKRKQWTIALGLGHGDSVNIEYAQTLPQSLIEFLFQAARTQWSLLVNDNNNGISDNSNKEENLLLPSPSRTIVICHSEPGAWSVPTSHYESPDPCPPPVFSEASTIYQYQNQEEEAKNDDNNNHQVFHKRIGRTMFETDRLPVGWSDRINQLDEVWVPTKFHQTIFQNGGVTIPIQVVGQGIDVNYWNPDSQNIKPLPLQRYFQKTKNHDRVCLDDDYKFLSVFKWEQRKAPDILVKSFWKAFPPIMRTTTSSASQEEEETETSTSQKRGACLIIVTNMYHTDQKRIFEDLEDYWIEATNFTRDEFKQAFSSSASQSKRRQQQEQEQEQTLLRRNGGIVLLSNLPITKMVRLYKAVDAFVLPSRGEGWGRPYMEAMAMGLPVIATNWSGPTEFITNDNGYLLPITGLVDSNLDAFPNHQWANPDGEKLQELFLHLVQSSATNSIGNSSSSSSSSTNEDDPHDDSPHQKGKQARKDIVTKWSHHVIARDILKHLERLSSSSTKSTGAGNTIIKEKTGDEL